MEGDDLTERAAFGFDKIVSPLKHVEPSQGRGDDIGKSDALHFAGPSNLDLEKRQSRRAAQQFSPAEGGAADDKAGAQDDIG